MLCTLTCITFICHSVPKVLSRLILNVVNITYPYGLYYLERVSETIFMIWYERALRQLLYFIIKYLFFSGKNNISVVKIGEACLGVSRGLLFIYNFFLNLYKNKGAGKPRTDSMHMKSVFVCFCLSAKSERGIMANGGRSRFISSYTWLSGNSICSKQIFAFYPPDFRLFSFYKCDEKFPSRGVFPRRVYPGDEIFPLVPLCLPF